MSDRDVLKTAREQFAAAEDGWGDNRTRALEDLRFARLGEQWPDEVSAQRAKDKRPCMTINKLPAFIRQVVNDARQNKPAIRVRPIDNRADVKTAEIINGLIRHIEQASDADVAYDTAAEYAVTMGFGYFRIDIDYAGADSFDTDVKVLRVRNPFSVYGDPKSHAADASDWRFAFVTEMKTLDEFKAEYPDADPVDWKGDDQMGQWATEDTVRIAEWFEREEVAKTILLLSDGHVVSQEGYAAQKALFDALGVTVARERQVKAYKMTHRLITGSEVLKETAWPGCLIPIVPVYGDEIDVEGRVYYRGLIHDAKDAQRNFNFWRTAATELVALAPKAPWVGPAGAFVTDAAKWESANTSSHAYIEYDGPVPPQRQPFAGVPAGALQEALNSADDMKAIMGLYDASLGARSNETSGKAIMARQREGDTSTFHFIDNLTRAIRYAGRVMLELIPAVYNTQRVIRILGEDGTQELVQLGGPGMVDLTAGKYDLQVQAGPGFTTRRQEAAEQMTEMVRAFPNAAPLLGDLLAKNLDWPDADKVADRLKFLLPPEVRQAEQPQQQGEQLTPEVLAQQAAAIQQQGQALQLQAQQIQQAAAQIEQAKGELAKQKEQVDTAIKTLNHEQRVTAEEKTMAIERLKLAEQKSALAIDQQMGAAADKLEAMMADIDAMASRVAALANPTPQP